MHDVRTFREKQKLVRLMCIRDRLEVPVGVNIHCDDYVISQWIFTPTGTSRRSRIHINLTNFCFSRNVLTSCIHLGGSPPESRRTTASSSIGAVLDLKTFHEFGI